MSQASIANPNPARDLSAIRSVVVKLGTQLLSDADKKLDVAFLGHIARQVALLRQRGVQVTLVSSGAIGAGLRELNLAKRPVDLPRLQAVASVGQRRLMDGWADAFAPFGMPVAQLLLTRDDIDHRTRYLNLRNTLAAIQQLGAVAIINENDSISTDEIVKITFGDNDILAALVCEATRAQLLILLTVVDGLLDEKNQPVRRVPNLAHARALVRKEKSALGKGGMDSKLEAARMVTGCGDQLIVANGRMEDILPRLLAGEELGTLFEPAQRKPHSRSRWIGSIHPRGVIRVDAGALRAVVEKNRSLLAAGVVDVEGDFEPGQCVAIYGPDAICAARGLCNYSAQTVRRIAGKKSGQIRALLGEAAYEEVIHRDNLVKEN